MITPLDTPTPAEILRAGEYTGKRHRAWKPSPYRMRLMRAFILERDDYTCQECGYRSEIGAYLELDHVRPYKHGGYFITSNLQVLCMTCNILKGAKY